MGCSNHARTHGAKVTGLAYAQTIGGMNLSRLVGTEGSREYARTAHARSWGPMPHRQLEAMLLLGYDPEMVTIDSTIVIRSEHDAPLVHKCLRHYAPPIPRGAKQRTLCGLNPHDRKPPNPSLPLTFCTHCLQRLAYMRRLAG